MRFTTGITAICIFCIKTEVWHAHFLDIQMIRYIPHTLGVGVNL